MNRILTSKVLLVLALALPSLANPSAAEVVLIDVDTASPEEIVNTRQVNFRGNGRAMKAINNGIKAGDMAAVATAAAHIGEWGDNMTDYFPPSTAPGAIADDIKHEALADIWQDWDDFAEKAEMSATAAHRLARLAAAGDSAGLGDAFKAVAATCSGCHRLYRK